MEKILSSCELQGTLLAKNGYGIPFLTNIDLRTEITEEAYLSQDFVVDKKFQITLRCLVPGNLSSLRSTASVDFVYISDITFTFQNLVSILLLRQCL